jgi:hypothetical protein
MVTGNIDSKTVYNFVNKRAAQISALSIVNLEFKSAISLSFLLADLIYKQAS